MDVSQKASFLAREVSKGLQSYMRPVCAGVFPAGPDGIRGQGSYLITGLDAQLPYRISPAPV